MSFTIGDDMINGSDIQDRIDEIEANQDTETLAEESASEEGWKHMGSNKFRNEKWTFEHQYEFDTWVDLCKAFGIELVNNDEDAEELKMLKEVAKMLDGYSDGLKYTTLIHERAFKDYAYGFAEDLELIKHNAQWPYTCINWDDAASELQADYTSVELGSHTYWFR